MTYRSIGVAAIVCLVVLGCDGTGGNGTLADRASELTPVALGQPLAAVTDVEAAQFTRGELLFDSTFTPPMGLGPLFNGSGCSDCHAFPIPGSGGVETVLHATAFRGGVCDELQDVGGPVIQLKVTPALHDALGIWQKPIPARATGMGIRTTPAVWGSGLLDAIPDSEILAHADPSDRDGDGVAGRPNWTVDGRLGRFGRKAQVASLHDFVGIAFTMEMGLTNSISPDEQTVDGQPLPPGVDPLPDPELSDDDLAATEAFVRFLAPPAPLPNPDGGQGRAIFTRIGCATCHIPELVTGTSPIHALSNKVVPAYTDLLLHDMGPELADICFGVATPGDFRTEPLWGLRYRFEFLHDGRAKSVSDAITEHGGEALGARDRFNALSATERALLLNFLGSL